MNCIYVQCYFRVTVLHQEKSIQVSPSSFPYIVDNRSLLKLAGGELVSC